MSTREEYNACIRPYITGSKPKEQRKMDFCIGAKICSGKAANEQEARVICSQPKAEKPANSKKSRRRGIIDTGVTAACIIDKLQGAAPTLDNLSPIIANCLGQKVEKSSREKFIKNCFKENTSGDGMQYDIKEAQKLRAFCIKAWNEREAVS